MAVKTEYFLKGKLLGTFQIPELTDHKQREQIAKENGIKNFDKIVLDDGRVIMETIEVWKDITGYEGLYQISNLSRVKSLKKIIDKGKWGIVIFPEKILKPVMRSKKGYFCVNLYKNKKGKLKQIHRLEGIEFKPNPESKSQINHIDGIKTNIDLNNIEWNTPKENAIHCRDHGLEIYPQGIKNGQCKLTEEQVKSIIKLRPTMSIYKLSEMFQVSNQHISRICKKQRWAHIK